MFTNHHLNLEQQLEELICSQLRDPTSLKFGELQRFPAKVGLARALAGKQPDDHLWEILDKFNETRNAFAHRNKPPISEKFADLKALVTNALPSADVADETQVMMSAFKICTWFIQDIKRSLPPPLPQKSYDSILTFFFNSSQTDAIWVSSAP